MQKIEQDFAKLGICELVEIKMGPGSRVRQTLDKEMAMQSADYKYNFTQQKIC